MTERKNNHGRISKSNKVNLKALSGWLQKYAQEKTLRRVEELTEYLESELSYATE